ncbi:MAG TPA: HTTM domain-containing protein [Polyangiaceae bacterium]|nr:HTTM domain-containing protein [Polyangiaceae bacterium]
MNAVSSGPRRLDAFFYPAAPAERLAWLRVLVGAFAVVYLIARFRDFAAGPNFSATSFAPVGPIQLLSAPLPPALVHAQTLLAIASGAAFVIGFRYRVMAPLFAVLLLWVTSYRSSWGMVFHTDNLLALHVLLLAAAPAADALAYDSRNRPASADHGKYGWAIRALCVVTVITYVLAGIAKLRISGSEWFSGDVLRAQIAYDNLRKIELGSVHSPLGAWLVKLPWVFPPLAVLTLLLELGAPLSLLTRKLGKVWVLGVLLFHWGVLALMAIAFPYPLTGIAYAAYFDVEKFRPLRHAARLLRR